MSVGARELDYRWTKMRKFVTDLGRGLPTWPLGIVVFGCQIVWPVRAKRDETEGPPIIRVDLEGVDFGR